MSSLKLLYKAKTFDIAADIGGVKKFFELSVYFFSCVTKSKFILVKTKF